MWQVTNRTPYKAERTWVRDVDGVHQWVVVVKATFTIGDKGSLALADEQVEPLHAAEYNGEDGASSVRYDADLIAPKPTTDVVINGTAYAPRGRPSADFMVSARVDRTSKVLRVIGNRRWQQGGPGEIMASDAEPIAQLPIVYERAYGGFDRTDPDPKKQRIDLRNPVGTGVSARAAHLLGQAVPNFEYPGGSIERAGPAGFGAIACHWSPRIELAGTYDKAWQEDRKPLLPRDWDARSLLCSPADQRPASHLRGGEEVELANLTPSGRLRFALPKHYFAFTTRFGTKSHEHRGQLASVIIEPDHPRVIMVWQTELRVRGAIDDLDETIVLEKAYV